MGNWTPGPWRACKDGECSCGHVWSMPADMPVFTAAMEGESSRVIGLANAEWGDAPDLIYGAINPEQQRANARLIAAAPAPVEALKAGYLLALKMPPNSLRIRNQHALCVMRDAIAAATGRDEQDVQEEFEALASATDSKAGQS